MDRWQSQRIICTGGLDLSEDALTQGTLNVGTAKVLQNYEPSLEGGYSKILGFIPYSDTEVTGTGPILGVKVALGGVFAARNDEIYFSTGSSWTAITNPVGSRASGATKVRFIAYTLGSAPLIALCDGVDFAAKYDGTTYTLLDDVAGAPEDPKYALFAKSRLILAGHTANPSSIILTAPTTDDDFDSANGAIEIAVGDIVVGLRLFRDVVYIFCQNSIKKLTGSSASDFAISPVTSSIGCISGDSIQEIGGDLIFLAPDGLRSLAATDRIGDVDLALQSRKIQPLIREIVGNFNEDAFNSLVIRKKSQYRLHYYDPASSSDDTVAKGFLGKITNEGYEWATLLGINVKCSDSEYSEGDEVSVFGHPSDGMVYKLEEGFDFNGETIEAIYKTPQLTFEDATLRKVLQKITVYTDILGDIGLSLNVLYDFETINVVQPPTIAFAQLAGLSNYGTAVYDTDVYSNPDSPVFRKNLLGSGFTAALVFSSDDTKPSHRIDSYQIEYSVKGRR